ncbi:PRA1 family protein 3-like [Limulus polyphemus]|uniref:PRA1 family protein n=1 Tax=Limulus polyphemus TaxID=6850 RepID=A0ABM1TR63_LIMPO|nr:PRA1 family protein 3-like [Limulus polyphemus]
MAEVEVAPLRALDDFLLGSATFQIPNVKNLDKWANRVMNNLLYYQTNYFVMATLVFLIIGVICPSIMVTSTFFLISGGYFIVYMFGTVIVFFFGITLPLLRGYFIVYMFGTVIIFLFGITLPLLLIIIHASLRLRNFKNKLTNRIETVGLRRTPMGIFLEALGQEPETTV